jgi:hypothetical protein
MPTTRAGRTLTKDQETINTKKKCERKAEGRREDDRAAHELKLYPTNHVGFAIDNLTFGPTVLARSRPRREIPRRQLFGEG